MGTFNDIADVAVKIQFQHDDIQVVMRFPSTKIDDKVGAGVL